MDLGLEAGCQPLRNDAHGVKPNRKQFKKMTVAARRTVWRTAKQEQRGPLTALVKRRLPESRFLYSKIEAHVQVPAETAVRTSAETG